MSKQKYDCCMIPSDEELLTWQLDDDGLLGEVDDGENTHPGGTDSGDKGAAPTS